jgi:hypothetical protein
MESVQSDTGPSDAEIAAQQSLQEASNLHAKGVEAWNSHDYQRARDLFKEALDQSPGNAIFSRDYEDALKQVSAQEAERQRVLEEQKRLAEEQRRAEEQKRQIAFKKSKQAALHSMKGIQQNDFGLKGVDSSSADLGLKGVGDSRADELGLKGLDLRDAVADKPRKPDRNAQGGRLALDQANTSLAETTGLRGGSSDNLRPTGTQIFNTRPGSGVADQADTTAKDRAGRVFDQGVALQNSGINTAVDLRGVGQAPQMSAAVRKDPRMIAMQRQLDDVIKVRDQTEKDLAANRETLARSDLPSADRGKLMVEGVKIKESLTQAEQKVANGQQEQKKLARRIETEIEEKPATTAPGSNPTGTGRPNEKPAN